MLDKELLQRVLTCATKKREEEAVEAGRAEQSKAKQTGRKAAPELITQSHCRQDHTLRELWRDKGAARSLRDSEMSRSRERRARM